MKKTLVIAALALAATPAFASKARLNALANSAHLEDIQKVFTNPADVTKHGDWLTFEFGNSSGQLATQADPRAEGGFSRGMGDARYGFYLGHRPAWVTEARTSNANGGVTLTNAATILGAENPVDLFYGSKAGALNWGVGLHYSNSDKKATRQKQSTTGLTAGVSADAWDAALTLGLVNNYKLDDDPATGPNEAVDFKGKTAIQLYGEYQLNDTLSLNALARMNGAKEDSAGAEVTDRTMSTYSVGVVNSHKADGADFFYGANYEMTNDKNAVATEDKVTTSALPVFVGIEADATSWMVLRGSVRQNFILGSTKVETNGTGDANTVAQNTSVAAGAGLKFGKLLVDGTLEAASSSTAALNGNAFLANGSITYMF